MAIPPTPSFFSLIVYASKSIAHSASMLKPMRRATTTKPLSEIAARATSTLSISIQNSPDFSTPITSGRRCRGDWRPFFKKKKKYVLFFLEIVDSA